VFPSVRAQWFVFVCAYISAEVLGVSDDRLKQDLDPAYMRELIRSVCVFRGGGRTLWNPVLISCYYCIGG
jgi:hypothetical protein